MRNFLTLLIFFVTFFANIEVIYAAALPVTGSFVIESGEVGLAQRLLNGDGQTGVINVGGGLYVTDVPAISVTAANVQVTNNGLISPSSGISTSGSNTSIINNGTIIIGVGNGIVTTGADTVIVNSGTIAVSGTSSAAVRLHSSGSNDSTFTNTGTISATGSATEAIVGGSGVQTVYLGKGSRIIGSVDLGGGTSDSITVTGNGISGRVLTSGNTESLTVNSGTAGVVVGNAIHTIDPTSVASLTIGANNLSVTVGDVVNSQIIGEDGQKAKVWTKAFGSSFARGDDIQNLAYDHNYLGVVVGYEYDSGVGMTLGLSSGSIKTDSQSFRSDVDSLFVGLYKRLKLADSIFLSGNLLTGYEKYKNKRDLVDNINGVETARSDVNNLLISPSVAIENRIKLYEIFEIKPQARITYTSSFFGSSNETGSTASNINIESRKAQVLNTRAGVSGAVTLFNNYKFNLGLGLDSRIIKEGKANASVSGSKFKFDTNNDRNVTGRYVNVGFRLLNLNSMNFGFTTLNLGGLDFGVDAEIRSASGKEEQKSVSLNASYRF